MLYRCLYTSNYNENEAKPFLAPLVTIVNTFVLSVPVDNDKDD